MDVFTAIETRRSIRKYQGRSIPDDALHRILEAGRLAPSAANRQPWGVVVVREAATKAALAKACNNCSYVADCAAFLVCFGDARDEWYEVDAALAMANMALTAWDHGIGSCYVGYFDEDYLKALLHIPPDMKVVVCMALGYPAESPDARPRKALDDLVHWERYRERPSSPPL
jgi:nitroreductase